MTLTESQLREANSYFASRNIDVPADFVADGKCHPLDFAKTKFIWGSPDVPLLGALDLCAATGIQHWEPEYARRLTGGEKWRWDLQRSILSNEIGKLRRDKAEACRDGASTIWNSAKPLDLPADPSLRQIGDQIVMQVADCAGRLHGLAFAEDEKPLRFLAGTIWSGHFHLLGPVSGPRPIAVCIDLPSALVIRNLTGWATAVAFVPENLMGAALALRGHWGAPVAICVGRDSESLAYAADRAAASVFGRVLKPPRGDSRRTWSEYASAVGLQRAGHELQCGARGFGPV